MKNQQLVSFLLVFAGLVGGVARADNPTVIGADPSLQAGALALQTGRYEEGVRLTLLGLDATVQPRARVTALSNVCAGYVGLGQHARAIEYCNAALDLRPQYWRALNNRALAWLGQHKLHAALADVRHGLAVNPDARSLQRSLQLVRAAQDRQALTAAVSTVSD